MEVVHRDPPSSLFFVCLPLVDITLASAVMTFELSRSNPAQCGPQE